MYCTSNQYDLDVAIREITCEGGIYEDLFFSHSENPYKILPTSDNWVLWSIVFCGNGMYKTIILSLPKCSSYFSLRVVVEQSVLGTVELPLLIDGRESFDRGWCSRYRFYKTLLQSFGKEGRILIQLKLV